MAIMYPQNISEYMPTDSERIVYHALKTQLPDDYQVFYSVEWTTINEGTLDKSEADFIVVSPDYGFLCLEVKGGSKIVLEDGNWYVEDTLHGSRSLSKSPYEQAEKSMYFLSSSFQICIMLHSQEYWGLALCSHSIRSMQTWSLIIDIGAVPLTVRR